MHVAQTERDFVASLIHISSRTFQRKAENKLNGMVLFIA